MKDGTTAIAAFAAFLALLTAGCATSPPQGDAALAPGATGGTATGGYQLTEDDKALDCKQLTGRMQVRILQVRDYSEREKTSLVSRGMQTAASTVFGGATHGASPDGDQARAVAQLEAYNQLLAAKNCRTFDLASELQPKPITATPTPKPKPEAPAAAKK